MHPFVELRDGAGFRTTAEWETPGGSCLVGIREHGFALYTGRGDAFHFDPEGRLRRAAFVEGDDRAVHYLRGLDGRLLEKRPLPDGRRASRRSGPVRDAGDRRRIYARAHGAVLDALEGLREHRAGRTAPPFESGEEASSRRLLERAARYDPRRLERETRRFLEVYRPPGVLPPDRYGSLVLQATEGCAYTGCTFCTLYSGQRYRVKGPEEFLEHIRRVKAFAGGALPLHRGVFLGEANALSAPRDRLLRFFEHLHRELPGLVRTRAAGPTGPTGPPGSRPARGVASFSDVFTTRGERSEELEDLAALGLRRVFLGVETGDEGLLEFLRKPASNERVRERVASLKGAGVSVGVILLIGAGGERFGERHVERSIDLVRSLPLDRGDAVYLSPLVVEPGGEYARHCAREGIAPLSPDALEAQTVRFRRELRAPGHGARVAPYDLRSFIYT